MPLGLSVAFVVALETFGTNIALPQRVEGRKLEYPNPGCTDPSWRGCHKHYKRYAHRRELTRLPRDSLGASGAPAGAVNVCESCPTPRPSPSPVAASRFENGFFPAPDSRCASSASSRSMSPRSQERYHGDRPHAAKARLQRRWSLHRRRGPLGETMKLRALGRHDASSAPPLLQMVTLRSSADIRQPTAKDHSWPFSANHGDKTCWSNSMQSVVSGGGEGARGSEDGYPLLMTFGEAH